MSKKGIARLTAFCVAAGFVFGQSGMLAIADVNDDVLVGIANTSKVSDEAVTYLQSLNEKTQETETETETETEAPKEVDRSMVGSTGFAQVEEYLNVRASGDSEGEVVGKVYNNGSVEILDVDENGWYYVRSGNVEGYVSSDYVAIGEKAEAIASASGYTTATIGAEVLNVRADATTDSDIVGLVENAENVEVVEEGDEWVKVVLDDGTYGYVSAEYVDTRTEYATGETLEEEQARLDEQWLAYLAEQEAIWAAQQAAQAAAEAAYVAQLQAQAQAAAEAAYAAQAAAEAAYAAQTQAYTTTSSSDSADAQAAADAQYQAYLDAQSAADAAVANEQGEAAIVDTAAAAESAYAEYLSAQAAADAAAQAQADAAYAAEQAAAQQAAADAAAAAQAQADAAAAAQAEAEAAQAAADAAAQEAQAQADASAQETLDAQAAAEAQYQAYLDAQAAADTAVANEQGEESISNTAAAAQSAYEEYLSAQAAADAAAQAEEDAAYAAEQAAAAQAEADAAAAAQAAADAAAAQAEADAAAQAAAAQAEADAAAAQAEADAAAAQAQADADAAAAQAAAEAAQAEAEAAAAKAEAAAASASTGSAVANYATQFVGNPYVWGGTSLTNGADCSGFVMSVYQNFGISLPHSAAAQSGYGTEVSMNDLQPGDLLFYSNGGGIGHVTMYIGNGQVVHASSSTTGIIISDVGYRTPVSARRLV